MRENDVSGSHGPAAGCGPAFRHRATRRLVTLALVFALTVALAVIPAAAANNRKVQVFPFNNLGMHCVDREYSVYSILPPFNEVYAQAVYRNPNGMPVLLGNSLVTMEYRPVSDLFGSTNSTSIGKTDFWAYAFQLFGIPLDMGEGLLGYFMPADDPLQAYPGMEFDPAFRWFAIEGLPITPVDDALQENSYPMMRIVARRASNGSPVGYTDVVVPVSNETDCQNCHATGQMAASRPGVVWSSDPDMEIQTKTNVLILHDDKNATSLVDSTPVLCAQCHYSAALDLAHAGPQGDQLSKPTMSEGMHAYHGQQTLPDGTPVFPVNGTTEQTCYQCHPGAETQCQRGAMRTGGMVCQNCHGGMLSVGGIHPLLPGGSIDGQNDGNPRRAWMDLPRCQSCHTGDAVSHLSGPEYVMAGDGIRLRQTFLEGDESASPILAASSRFAENENSLFRFSRGHGGLACEGCHGSTHAIWPIATTYSNDNLTAYQLQGHVGTITECGTCHAAGTLPSTATGGPHGMHNVNQQWVAQHKEVAEHNLGQCRPCHGTGLGGTPLARTQKNRTFAVGDGQQVTLAKGTEVSCTRCHEMPEN